MDGILNVLKPSGMSSHDVVGFVRKCTGIKKVGHAGTLDPHAVGVLPILVGRATKLSDYIMDHDKIYRVHIYFGIATSSGDSEGEVLERNEDIHISIDQLQKVIEEFIGEIEQTPPAFSAIKVNGKRLYELARKGIETEIPTRKVTIYDIWNVKEVRHNLFSFDVKCSKGTYIRSLCIDIGKKLDAPAFMSMLIRIKVGSFNIEDSFTLEELKEEIGSKLIPADGVIPFESAIALNDSIRYIMNGCSSSINFLKDFKYIGQENIKVYDEDKKFIGIAKIFDENNRKVFKITTFFSQLPQNQN